LILNPSDNPKLYQDTYETVKQKFPPAFIYEVPMSNNKAEPLDDMWGRYIDLDEQLIMQELHLEQ
jgi:hypothetical protein